MFVSKVTNYKGPTRSVDTEDETLPDRLNDFYARFDRDNKTTPAPLPVSDDEPPPFIISDHDVRCMFKRQKVTKAAGSDSIKPKFLRYCSNEITPIFTYIFNLSLQTCIVPSCFKFSTIIPVPKKSSPETLNDYRPVALTSVIMKCFEKLVLRFVDSLLPCDFDPFQFAYKARRSTDDAIAINIHELLNHAEKRNAYSRVLFIDFSSAFNTIIPCKLYDKLVNQLHFPVKLCNWILNFLLNRPQTVKIGDLSSSVIVLNTGSPQGCLCSPKMYSLFTHDCVATFSENHVFKFADDTTVTGLITDNNEDKYRQEINSIVHWCDENNLILNVSKTKELIIDFKKNKSPIEPLIINEKEVEIIDVFKFLGVYVTNDLSWHMNCSNIYKKCRQRIYFLRQLASFNVNKNILLNFYRGIIESILTSSIIIWYGRITYEDLEKLNSIVRTCELIIGTEFLHLNYIYHQRLQRKTKLIMKEHFHPANKYFQFLRSGKRLRHFKGAKRFINSTYPQAVRQYNNK